MLGLAQIAADRPGDPGAGHGIAAGMGDRDLPLRGPADLVVADLTVPEIQGEVLVERRKVEEVAADDVAPPARAQDEAAEAPAVVALHDVE